MSQIIAVTAGKGGTGKSTTSANVATALAALGKKTLVVELDFGLRCLDIMLGIKDKVKHDIGEYLEGKIDILTATTKVDRVDNLYLVCATRNPFIDINPEKIMEVCQEMRKHFDYIIMDTAGIGSSVFSVIKAAELILMVTTPDTVCVRDGAILSDFLYVKNCTNQRLVINKVSPNPLRPRRGNGQRGNSANRRSSRGYEHKDMRREGTASSPELRRRQGLRGYSKKNSW